MTGQHANLPISVDTILATERTILRYPLLSDGPRIFSAIQSSQFPAQLPLKEIKAMDEVEAWIKRAQSNWQKGRSFLWTVEACKTELMLGQVTLSRKSESDVWALAFWIHPDSWGQGYGSEAAGRVVGFGFEVLKVSKIWAGAGMWNERSCRVLEKLGMKYLRDNPEGYFIRGEAILTKEYELTLDQWLEKCQRKGE